MTAYYQETDSKVVFALPRVAFPLTIKPTNETTGSALHAYYLPIPIESGLFRSAWKVVRQLLNQEMAKEARKLLTTIQDIVISFQQSRFDLASLPLLNAFIANDGSMYFEWTSSDFRVGFSIEPDPSESGWYLVSNKKLGEISASGYITGIDIKNLIVWLLSFVLSNS
jgi:hypothetical protein